MMSDIYEANAPAAFPAPQEQPRLEEDSPEGGVLKNPPVKETVDRWKKEVFDKIQYLRENLEQANQEKEALSREVDQLQSELTASRGRIKELEAELSEALDTFNTLLDEVSQALES
jgi:predicted  nucleic acid-binding Zn-ribbon protein